jgi:hypothetical protein
MKRLFIVTYYVCFDTGTSQHDRFQKFWIWNVPTFFDWMKKKRQEVQNQVQKNIVVINCGKL